MLVFSEPTMAQPENTNLDFVVVIDNIIPPTLARTKIQLIYTTDSFKVFEVYYHPGMLSFKKNDYEMLLSDTVKSVNLCFSHYRMVKNNQIEYNYQIELKIYWLKSLYNVINIYNLDTKLYRKKYEPLDKNRNYTFELLSPDYTFKRVRKVDK